VGRSRFTDPTAYNVVSSITPEEFVVSDLNSWKGIAVPEASFENENGRRLHFGVVI
jgi:hypothetical protein